MARQFFSSLFPRPRRSVSWKDALPLIIFLIAFVGICLWAELTDKMMFVRPWAFALIVFAPWIWWMAVAGYAGLSKSRTVVSTLIRLCLVGLFIVLIAEPRAVRTRDVMSVVYCVDISDSVDKSTDKSLEFVAETVMQKQEGDQAGLVVFGRNSAVELPPRESFPFEGVLNSRIERDATNLEQALSLAAAMLPEENRGRIVLVSDGTETVGSLREVLDDLKSREIAVDVVGIGYDYKNEVLLERLDLPQFVKMGESYNASIVLSSLTDGAGQLVVQENGETIYDEPVEYKAGKKKFEVPIQLRQAGYYEYKARIITPEGKDNLDLNNEVQNFLYVEGEGKVLLVHEPLSNGGDSRDYEKLAEAIRAGDRLVELREGFDFPRDALSLMPYDAVLFVNVGNDVFDAIQLNALKDAVYNMGVGFMMVGGKNSFGPGGYHRSPVEDILPVTMDITNKKILPKGALVIILHTCEFPEGNTVAKRITKQAIKVLGAQDEVGVIDYEGGEQWVFELTPAREYDKLAKLVQAANPGDMPSYQNTMKLGLEGLVKSDAASLHMIIISDGDPPPPTPKLLQDFKDNEVSVSTVAIWPHGGRDVSTLRSIATVTLGRYYFPSNPDQLPGIFIKEAKTLKRSMIQNKKVVPQMEFPDAIVEGIVDFPPIHGFVLTTPKEGTRGKTILKVPPEEDGDLDPVLAVGRYGLGVTAAYTSDLSLNWGKDLVEGWRSYEPFIKQLMTRISRVRKEGHLRMWTYTTSNEGVIIVEDYHPDSSFLDITARVAGPRDKVETVSVKQVGPRRYQATVPLWGRGRYQIMVNGTAGKREDDVQGGFIVPYSPEYLQFRENHVALMEIAERTDGQFLMQPQSADDVDENLTPVEQAGKAIYGRRLPKQSSWPVFDWFLVALACLIPLDVGFRRVQIDWNVIKGWFSFKSATESTQTMGALLDRKKKVASTFEQKTERPLAASLSRPVSQPSTSTSTRPQSTKPADSKPKQEEPADDGSTTSRLLRMKKQRSDDEDLDWS